MTWRPLPVPRAEQEPRGLGPSLERIAAALGAPPPSTLRTVFARWADLVGADVAAHATPRTLRHGVLTVVVDHPAWATSLRLLAADLLARAAAEGVDDVTELVVVVDPGPGRATRVANDDGRGGPPPARRSRSGEGRAGGGGARGPAGDDGGRRGRRTGR